MSATGVIGGAVLDRLRHACRAVTDGGPRWGSVVVAEHPRAQWVGYLVIVYPPGTSTPERRAMLAHRHWPLGGALVLSVAVLVLCSWWPAPLVALAGVAIYGAGIWTTAMLTQDLRRRSVRMRAGFMAERGHIETVGEARFLLRTLVEFETLEAKRRLGEVNDVEYEFRWAALYDGVLATHRAIR